MRFVAAGLVVLASGGAAVAAPCNPMDATVAGRTASVFTDDLAATGGGVPGNVTCTVSADLAIPDGHYGVYKVDSTTFTVIDGGETVTYSATAFGTTRTVVTDGPFDGAPIVTQYFGTGLGPVAAFEGDFELTV